MPLVAMTALEMVVLMGDDDEVEAGAPAVGDGLLLESDTGGTDFLLLEDPVLSFLLLES